MTARNEGGAGERIDHGLEHGKHGIAGVVHDPAVMAFDDLGKDVEVFAQPPMGGVLVLAGQPAVTGHVGIEDGGELSWQSCCIHGVVPVSGSGSDATAYAGMQGIAPVAVLSPPYGVRL